MKVHELIAKLEKCDPQAKVLVYSGEDFTYATGCRTRAENQGEAALYCKGYSFQEYHGDTAENYVLIHDARK